MTQKYSKKHLFIKIFLSLLVYQLIKGDLACGSGTYFNELTGLCEQCFQGCSACNGYQQKDCLDCLPNYYKVQLQNQFLCLACPAGQYFNQNTCQSCKYDCSICLSLSKCLVCQTGYIMDSTYEICSDSNCAYGYFRNPLNNQCQQCPSSSYFLQCGVTQQVSNGVVTGFSIFPIKCLDTFQINTAQNTCGCFSGVYLNNGVCVPCQDPNCQVCSQTGCTYCKIGYFNQQGSCVLNCKPSFYYQQTSNNYHFSCFPFTFHKIVQINGQNVSNNWKGYDPKFGIFDDICQPFLYKLFDYNSNTYQCVSVCPIGYTLNLIRLSCVQNNCQNDITLQINGNCFFRTCPESFYFQPFQSFTQYSTCVPITINQCLYQQDESTSQCLTCQPSYFTSSCVQNCPSQIYYLNNNSCIKCDMTTPICSQAYFLSTYNVNGVNYNAYTCPTNYYLPINSTQCTKCSNQAMISCNSKPEYFCDIGQDNSDPSCPTINLSQMVGYSFDKYGNVVSGSGCLKKNTANNLCQICNSTFNYNFQGVCSQQFMKPTQYYMYYNTTESQYHVVSSCNPNQYIQSIQKSSYYMKYCKDFSTCLTTTQETINGQSQQICQKCSANFYNINGNCIESCPSYTFQNSSTKNCETPINYCDTYSSSSTPLCIFCQYGYLLYQTSPSNQCIPFNSCNNGYTYVYNLCIACEQNCNKCLSNKKCIQPSSNYYLYNDSPILSCPPGTYLSGFTCLNCGQYCQQCTDSNICTQRLPASLLYLMGTQVYVYFNPVCQLNQYYDTNLQQCINCDMSCAQCFQSSSKCLLCSDSTQSLYQFTCVQQCPKGYYTSIISTTNYTRNVCLQCDSSCLKCNQTTCSQCAQPNMYQNPANPFICQASNDPCCSQVDIATGICQQCYSNCLLDSQTNQCFQIIPYCSQYQLNDKTKCIQCQQGYYLTNKYNCCGVQNCKVCNSNNLQQCDTCNDQYQIDSNYQCQFNCLVINCQTCQAGNQNQCLTCISQYKTDGNFLCVFDCQVQNCQNCISGNQTQCQSCDSQYKLDLNKQCVFDCQVQNCQKCQEGIQNQCQTCISEYKIDNNFQCIFDCQVQNCQTCVIGVQSQCQVCESQYKLDSNLNCIFDCQVQNCQTCVTGVQNQCQVCESQYKLDSNLNCIFDCQVQNCQVCSSNDQKKCQQCNQQYKLDSNQQCIFDCQVKNCQTCVTGNQIKCLNCISQYKIDSDQQCIFDCQVQNCLTCKTGNQKQCSQCASQFIIDSNLQCVFDCQVSNCQTCKDGNQSQCQKCNPQYIINQNNQCIFDCQVSNCQTCVIGNQNNCQVCNQQYKLDLSGQCIFDCQVQNCQTCKDGNQNMCLNCISQYKTDSTGQCVFDCKVPSCQTCISGNQNQCLNCISQYKTNSSYQCVFDCQVPNCQTCLTGNQNKCQVCNLQYKADPSRQCIFDCQVQNCQTCVTQNQNQCLICNSQYKLNTNLQCIFDCLVQNCQQCVTGNQNTCQLCNSQYKIDQQGQCIFDCKVKNCQTCVNGNQNQCQNCMSQYKINISQECSFDCQVQNCQTCVVGNQNQCQICNPKYKVNSTGQCLFDCLVANCQTCIVDNQDACQVCAPSYKLDLNQKCIFDCQVSNCQTCVSGNQTLCQTCISQFKIDSNKQCILDCQVLNCQKCVVNNNQQCSICDQNYQLDSSLNCQQQCNVQNCKECQKADSFKCSQCLPQFQKDINSQCFQNCLVQNCQTCIDGNSYQCQVCNINYELGTQYDCIKAIQIFQNENQKILTSIISIALGIITYSLLFFIPFWMFVSIFDLLQTINLLIYANANYPLPLYIFLKLFNFSNFEFLPNIQSQTANVPQSYQREKVDSNIFSNMIQPSIIWFLAIFMYFLSYMHKIVNLRSKNIVNKVIQKYNQRFFFMIFVGLVFLTFYKYCVSFQLQMYDSNTNTLFELASVILSGILFTSQIILMLLGFQMNKSKQINSIIKKIEINFQEFSTLQFRQQYHIFNGIILVRKMLFVYALIFFSDTKIKQIIFIQCLFSIETLLLLLTRPFPDEYFNQNQILCRFCLLIGSVSINWIIYDDLVDQFSQNVRILLSVISIIFFSAIYISILILSIRIIKQHLFRHLIKKQNMIQFTKINTKI